MKMTSSWTATARMVASFVQGRFPIYSVLFTLLLAGLVLAAGCGDRGVQKAKQETAEAKATIAKLQLGLAAAQEENAKLRQELDALKQTRDQLQGQMDKTGQERDQAVTLAQQAKAAITQLSTRADGQVALEKQIADLKAQVKEQQKLIEDLQKRPAGEAKPAEVSAGTDANQPPPTEPNEKP